MKKFINDTGVNGRGEKIWQVIAEWTDSTGRKRSHSETFDNEAQAISWLKWS